MATQGDAVINRWNQLGFCREHQAVARLDHQDQVCDYCAIGACANPCEIFPFGELVNSLGISDTMRAIKIKAKWFGV